MAKGEKRPGVLTVGKRDNNDIVDNRVRVGIGRVTRRYKSFNIK